LRTTHNSWGGERHPWKQERCGKHLGTIMTGNGRALGPVKGRKRWGERGFLKRLFYYAGPKWLTDQAKGKTKGTWGELLGSICKKVRYNKLKGRCGKG